MTEKFEKLKRVSLILDHGEPSSMPHNKLLIILDDHWYKKIYRPKMIDCLMTGAIFISDDLVHLFFVMS